MTPQQEQAITQLGRLLQAQGYEFITPTPATHASVIARRAGVALPAADLRDVFGWSLPFSPEVITPAIMAAMQQAAVLEPVAQGWRSRVRFSSLGGLLLAHSAYPTTAADSIFFGPDTYRFCQWLAHQTPATESVMDMGCGSGAGGLWLASRQPLRELLLTDVNAAALAVARANAKLAGLEARTLLSDLFAAVPELPEVCIANPPYMKDAQGRAYRDGGGQHGEGLSIRMVREWLQRARPGQTFLLYTGSAICAGRDAIQEQALALCALHGAAMTHDELDPDVFGEELSQPGYEGVERIAAIGIKIRR